MNHRMQSGAPGRQHSTAATVTATDRIMGRGREETKTHDQLGGIGSNCLVILVLFPALFSNLPRNKKYTVSFRHRRKTKLMEPKAFILKVRKRLKAVRGLGKSHTSGERHLATLLPKAENKF